MADTHPTPIFDAKVVYVYSDMPSYSRAKKTLELFRDLFREVHFVGTRRHMAWDEYEPDGITCHFNPRVLGSGLGTIPDVARFYGFIRSKLNEIKPDVVVAVNEEYILPFTLGLMKKPPHLVLDLYDSIGMRIAGKGRRLRPLFRAVSMATMLTPDALVEVTEQRLNWHPYKPDVTSVVFNSPPRYPDISPLPGLPEKFLYVAGTLEDKIHGIEPLYAALEQVQDMQVLVTGLPKGKFVESTFLKHPRVTYLGRRPYEEVPRIAAASSGVYMHYNPVRLNYVYGAPNKLYEAMQVGVPVLINREDKISADVLATGFGYVSPFGDADALAADLRMLLSPSDELRAGCKRAQEIFEHEYEWNVMARERYTALFRQLRVNETRV
ncbi:glycosyltransferase [bacterium]|nr:glycosyltransferase [bacterium]